MLFIVGSAGYVGGLETELQNNVVTEVTRRAGFSWIDVGVALISGPAVAVSVTRGDMSSLVGVAISAALMPPAVNAALMMMLGVMNASPAVIGIGIGSLELLAMNIILIDLAAIVMFRIKKFTKTRSESLYHKPRPEPVEAKFTPAPAQEQQSPQPKPKITDNEKEKPG